MTAIFLLSQKNNLVDVILLLLLVTKFLTKKCATGMHLSTHRGIMQKISNKTDNL